MPELNGETRIIDCDVHNRFKDGKMTALWPYLPRAYQEDVREWGINIPNVGYPNGGDRGYRGDAWPGDGFPGSDLDLMREQLLDAFRHALGTRVDLHRGPHGGRLVIHFFSDEELQGLYDIVVSRKS